MRIYTLLYIVLLLLFTNIHAQNEPIISLTEVSQEGGVAITSVMCINEDNNGFIWFGTNNGLFRYNSNDIKKYSYSQSNPHSISTNRINKILTNNNGQLLIATENGLCKYNTDLDNFSRLDILDKQNRPIGINIASITQTLNGDYWLVDSKGLAKINPNLSHAEYIEIDEQNTSRARLLYKDNSDNIWVVYQDGRIYFKTKETSEFRLFSKGISGLPRTMFVNDGKVWIGYDKDGLLCFDINGNILRHYNVENEFPSDQIRSVIMSNDNKLWVATYKGIVIIKGLDIIKEITPENHPNLPHHSIWSLYKDTNNIVWIGTWLGGLSYYSEFKNSVTHFKQSNKNNLKTDDIITAFAPDPNNVDIWIGAESGSLYKYNQQTNQTTKNDVLYNKNRVKNIKSLVFDENNTLWIGTRDDGILYKNENENKFTQLKTPFKIGLQVLCMLPEKNGIWISDYQQGVFYYSFLDKTFKQYKHNPLDKTSISNNHIRKIIRDRKDNLWFATEKGLNLMSKDSHKFTHFFHSDVDSNSLSDDYIYSISEDSNGDLWIGTNGSGLDKLNIASMTFEHHSTKNGLPGDEIYSILEDVNSNLWLATNNGICKFYPKENKVLTFGHIDGIYNNSFTPNAGLLSNTGLMFFGGSNGFVYYKPNDILIRNTIKPRPIITNFFIGNEEVLPKQENNILFTNISNTENIKLDYSQKSFSFRFVANNYIDPDKNRFKYRLINFNDDWIETNINGSAVFTNVPPGKYTFEIIASNNDGIWNERPKTLEIFIAPPIWGRWYAFLFFGLITLSTMLYLRKQTINRQKLKNEIQLEKLKNESEENLHQLKLQFFTNITHEFRTPLTLILGPVNGLLNSFEKESHAFNQLNLIKNNSERLLRLINRILDFRKIDAGKLKLSPVHKDVISFTKDIFNCFSELARLRNIEYNFKSDTNSIKIDFDPEKLDKIIFNILSNAFKYSNDGSKIELIIKNNRETKLEFIESNEVAIGDLNINEFIEISICDTGVGISKENLSHIFERFYHTTIESAHGTGIGLNLSKEYLDLHKGKLKVNSVVKKGTIFSIYLPHKQEGPFNKIENLKNYIDEENSTKPNIIAFQERIEQTEDLYHDSLILIVEDNIELLNYLGYVLGHHFKVIKTKNGIEALEQTHSLFPDIIISDIMMPEMDGIELCETIKKDIRTSHIPVILLTALESVKNRISGLTSGADAYISKPFDDKLLITQIINLLESRKVLRESFVNIDDVWSKNVGEMDMDKKLILKAVQVVEKNISNIDFTVETLASELNLSRTTLHRKLKSLTDQSATEFIRYERLKHAVKLLQSGNFRMNEVSLAVGFNSHNYFSTSFKKQYGMTPSEFIKRKNYKN
ncbi:two-component regulator propeller domain-containing protein [Formosa sp. PL04]|uniref:hybrid sensor histidine kinase/response regulator transcription factor n=1 Tax=Formosa sp. PL04 TaxID=3081755 RepID=UPI0029821CDF|nr:two-component regulator propeller domain-containing protein [Formosa sp. PL04]MDW5289174.1 two-component regulator propeller domain-containing protein [Formosa sp. PL04]